MHRSLNCFPGKNTEKSPLTEKKIQGNILKYLKKTVKEGHFFKIHQGRYAQIGIADILGCFRGRFVAFEVKRPKGKLTVLQNLFLEKIREAGGIAEKVCSVDDVKEILENVETCTCISRRKLYAHLKACTCASSKEVLAHVKACTCVFKTGMECRPDKE